MCYPLKIKTIIILIVVIIIIIIIIIIVALCQLSALEPYCPLLLCFIFVKLTRLSRIEFPSFINWTSSFPFSGLLGGIFYSNFNRIFSKQTVEILIRRHILSHLIWFCTV